MGKNMLTLCFANISKTTSPPLEMLTLPSKAHTYSPMLVNSTEYTLLIIFNIYKGRSDVGLFEIPLLLTHYLP